MTTTNMEDIEDILLNNIKIVVGIMEIVEIVEFVWILCGNMKEVVQ
jgi:hypothetical protein